MLQKQGTKFCRKKTCKQPQTGPVERSTPDQALWQLLQWGYFLLGKAKATISLPPFTESHHHRDQQLGQNPNKWKKILPPCQSLYSSSIVHSSSLSLPLSLSVPTVSLFGFSSLPSPFVFLSSALHLLLISVHFCIIPLHLFHHLLLQICPRAPEC